MSSPAGEKIDSDEPTGGKTSRSGGKKMKKTALLTLLAFAGLLLIAAPAALAEDGAALFKAKCAACHGQDGSGDTAIGKKSKLRDLRSPEVQKQTDAELTSVIADGNGKPAHAYKKKGMTDGQIKAVVAHIRSIAKK
jgi:mono/diheme cytochrome c family protein